MLQDKRVKGFVTEIVSKYNVNKNDVSKMFEYEYYDKLEYYQKVLKRRLSPALREDILIHTLSICKEWVEEGRFDSITPAQLASYRVSALFFGVINQYKKGEKS